MSSHAIQVHPQFTRQPIPGEATAGRPWRAHRARALGVAGREPVRLAARPGQPPVGSIEEMIRLYVESQPAQLYRGGA